MTNIVASFVARFRCRSRRSPQPGQSPQSGQIGIIVLLIMVVLLTIGLSLASQSSKELSLSQQEEESTRVFNAAEAGVEQALSSDLSAQSADYATGTSSVPGSNTSVNFSVTKQRLLTARVLQGSTAMVPVTNSAGTQTASSITIQWGRETSCTQNPASLILSIYSYDTTKTPKNSVRYYAYTPCDYGETVTLSSTPGTNGYFRTQTIALNAKDYMVRIKPAHNDTTVEVTAAAGSLPVQSYTIKSTAANQGGNEQRAVQVDRTLDVAPSIFDYVLFSGTTLVK
jgi:Tfp pilus assembly protein PilX